LATIVDRTAGVLVAIFSGSGIIDSYKQTKGNKMTVTELIAALSKMPADASVVLMGSYETFDGYSHPFVELDADGEVVIREAGEDE
jgi:hypothetical protein